jgi:glycine cleavage system H protein
MDIPSNLRYSENHEWVLVDGEFATVGITDFAQYELGDIVFVELPDIGDNIQAGDPIGNLEAVKTVADICLPISGEIIKVNTDLADSPEMINKSPYGDGWLVKIRISNKEEIDNLLTAEEYTKLVSK